MRKISLAFLLLKVNGIRGKSLIKCHICHVCRVELIDTRAGF
jgi:hypothetical protein